MEQLLKISLRFVLQRYFDKTMNAPSTMAAYLANPCIRAELQVPLAWCQKVKYDWHGTKRSEYEASNDLRSKEQELELMEDLRVLISRDDCGSVG